MNIPKVFKRYPIRSVICMIAIISAVILTPLIKNSSFSRSYIINGFIGTHIKPALGYFFGLFSFSVAEVSICVLVIVGIILISKGIYNVYKSEARLYALYGLIANIIIVAIVIFIGFLILWGAYYYDEPLADKIGLNTRPITQQELYDVTKTISQELNKAAQAAYRDENGIAHLNAGFTQAVDSTLASYERLNSSYPFLKGTYSLPKPIIFSHIMKLLQISGVYFPYTAEANVDATFPDVLLPAVTAHEMAHQRGVAREDEANYLSFKVCIQSSDPNTIYSGYMLAYIHLFNALYSSSPQLSSDISRDISSKVNKDLEYYNAYLKQFEGPVGDVSEKINNRYLVSQGQRDGVKSYGQMVDLIVADYLDF